MAARVGAPVAFALGHGLVSRRVEEMGKLLNTVNQPGARTRPRRVRIHRDDPNRRGQNTATGQVVGQSGCALPVVAARGDHHHIWLRGFNVVPRDPPRRRASGAEHRIAPSQRDHLRDPMPGGERWVGPLQHRHPRPSVEL